MQDKEKTVKGNFYKICGQCGKVMISEDFDEFLKMVMEHSCNKVAA